MALANEPRVREFGGYVWLPKVGTIEEIPDPRRRATVLRRVIAAVELLLARLHTALDDAALDMRTELDLTYEQIAARTGRSYPQTHARVQRRAAARGVVLEQRRQAA